MSFYRWISVVNEKGFFVNNLVVISVMYLVKNHFFCMLNKTNYLWYRKHLLLS